MLNKAIRRQNRRRRPFATHVDERFYLGIDVPFRDRGSRLRSLIRPPATATDPARLEHRRHTLAWAATACIRGARSILVIGADDGFTALAALEPGRHVSTMEPGDSATGSTFDLVVCLQAESILGDDETTSTLPRLAGRAIVAAPAVPDYADPTARRLHRRLELYYRRVRLFQLPDPYVPWLEPMEHPNAAASIIAECTEPLVTDDEHSAADDTPAAT
jgi:hypothetical protein